MPLRALGAAVVLLAGAWLGLSPGCAQWQARQADKAANNTITSANKVALGTTRPFDVNYRPFSLSGEPNAQTIKVGQKIISLGSNATQKLTPPEALGIAFRNSRSFQDKVEALFSQALAVAGGRRSWNYPLLGGTITADAAHTKVNKGQEDNVATAAPDISLTQRFLSGGVLTAGYALDVLTDFSGARGTTVGSLLEANFTQPLLRGAWRGLAYEDQYRRERDLLLAVFEHERFRHTFAADITTRYYQLLQQQDRLTNQEKSIKRLEQTFAQTQVLVQGGQASRIQQDQAEQNLLNARIRLERDRQDYHNALDQFKIALGLPVAANVEGDYPAALDLLVQRGLDGAGVPNATYGVGGPLPAAIHGGGAPPWRLGDLKLTEDQAVQVAMSVRPDVLTQRANLRDAGRDVEIAADAFLPKLDLELGISAAGTGPRRFYRTRFDRHTRTAGASFEYDIDQTGNRDAYRNSMLDLAKARRSYSEFLDRVVLEVRQSYRELEQSRRSYELQVRNVEVAKRRRALADLQQKEGQAIARDVLEAEDALRDAQNGLTAAAVGYVTTRLKFLADLGMIEVDEKGLFHERDTPLGFENIQKFYPYLAQ
jgi:outer membrane protein TolC